MSVHIFSKNAVLEALEAKIPVKKVLLSSTLKDIIKLSEAINRLAPHVVVEKISKRKIETLSGGIRSGGVCAVLGDVRTITSIESMVSVTKTRNAPQLFVALDSIQDPRNFGAIIRSALGAGFHGIVYQKRRQAGITGVVASASAGAYFRIPLCEVVNIPRALKYLKRLGFWIYGAETGIHTSLYDTSFHAPLVIVIGSEGKGMRRLVRETCDEVITIPLQSGLDSLNASVASGIIMFEVMRQIHQNG